MPSPLPPIEIQLKRLPHGEGLPVPAYATAHAAGMDVVSAEALMLQPGGRHAVATGFAMAIPEGYEVQVRPRAGLALKHGISLPNTPGTIDADYRGDVSVILINHGQAPFTVENGERIAQLVLARYERVEWAVIETVEQLPASIRGAGGFGHTGTS